MSTIAQNKLISRSYEHAYKSKPNGICPAPYCGEEGEFISNNEHWALFQCSNCYTEYEEEGNRIVAPTSWFDPVPAIEKVA